ncbi:pyrimidine 5'-nucleotidase [Sphingomicrobium lutaoense]|uniref:Putative hydrolase of the HAD superfamily n=1 Tax=Sphingomicrobium lutaoense TaxID=515949 RepID=A0A839YWT0_9SPHN|nr:pyrimidine 5'-nucleotidase [Sphingomicrobium lutaoense]MBB3764661.1 putative hydrolase of the HAD superfamily [Sphingomicrobium lutaoense]
MDPRYAHITDWIFDLDNCLYPASTGLFTLIDARMNAYIRRLLGVDEVEAHRVQKHHFHTHGTTLAGLMKEHGVDPHDFLGHVHDIPLDRIDRDERLATGLGRLPGRRFIFTNGDEPYARRILGRLGIDEHFHGMQDILASNLRPKPDLHGYELMLERFEIEPSRAVLVEDMAKNLKPAKQLGLTTIWVDNGSEQAHEAPPTDHVDERIDNVADWLHRILRQERTK